MLKEITDKIALPYDTASETWSQCQGLPVLTEWNKNEGLTVYRGDHYEVPNNIEPPIQRKAFKNTFNDFSEDSDFAVCLAEVVKMGSNNLGSEVLIT